MAPSTIRARSSVSAGANVTVRLGGQKRRKAYTKWADFTSDTMKARLENAKAKAAADLQRGTAISTDDLRAHLGTDSGTFTNIDFGDGWADDGAWMDVPEASEERPRKWGSFFVHP